MTDARATVMRGTTFVLGPGTPLALRLSWYTSISNNIVTSLRPTEHVSVERRREREKTKKKEGREREPYEALLMCCKIQQKASSVRGSAEKELKMVTTWR